MSRSTQGFGERFKEWRTRRKLSQLDLALHADVSQRHISWLETEKSRPSRDMVIKLSEALDIPLRERNELLNCAGFASHYPDSKLDEPAMSAVMDAINSVLKHHDPYPALVVDRCWNVIMLNSGAQRLLSLFGSVDDIWQAIGDADNRNLARLTLHPKGLRPYISNWEHIAPSFIRRLRTEAQMSGSERLQSTIRQMLEDCQPLPEPLSPETIMTPVLPLEFSVNDIKLSLFSVISAFGTPQDVRTDDMRIECFYPSNTETSQLISNHQ